MAYQLALPPSLAAVHPVFHVSMLRRYVRDPAHVISYEPIQLQPDLSYSEQPVEILDRKVQELRSKSIPFVKILWRNFSREEATWELEERMKKLYPSMFGE